MSCENENAKLIPWYAAGTLEIENRDRVELHLRECADCRGRLALAREVVTYAEAHSPESLMEHVNPELLANYARGPEGLDRETTRWIEGHLRGCEDCGEALAIVRELPADTELNGVGQPADTSTPWLARAWDFFASTFLRPAPALAYLLLLVASFPIYRVMISERERPLPTDGTPVIDVGGSLRIDFLKGGSRGGSSRQRIPLTEQQPLVYLGIEPELPESAAAKDEYRIEILAGGTPRWIHRLTAAEIRRSLASDQLAVVLAVPASAVPPASYTLRVLPEGDGGEPILEIDFATDR